MDTPTPETNPILEERLERLDHLLGQIKNRDACALLHRAAGYSWKEVARRCGFRTSQAAWQAAERAFIKVRSAMHRNDIK
jgi:AraC-like DNA-binding protein